MSFSGRLPALATVALLLLSACVGRVPERPHAPTLQAPVDLHVLLPLTGDAAAHGKLQWDVVGLATRRLNQSRSPRDRPVRATIHDCGSTTDSAREALAGLIEAGVSSVVAPAWPAAVFGMQERIDDDEILIVIPDAGDWPALLGGPRTVTMLPPEEIRGALLIDAALDAVAPPPTTVAYIRASGEPASAPAQAAFHRAVARGLRPALPEDAELRILQQGADPPNDLVVRLGGVDRVARSARRTWTDPALDEATRYPDSERATAATFDAAVALGRALRRDPGAPVPTLRAAIVRDSWEGMLGPTRFVQLASGAWTGHLPTVESP